MDLEFEKVAALLSVVEKCAGHSGKLGAISNAAMAELLMLNGKVAEDAKKANADKAALEAADKAHAERANKPLGPDGERDDEEDIVDNDPRPPGLKPRTIPNANHPDNNPTRRL